MQELALNPNDERARLQREHTVFAVILAVSFCHLLNDMMQALLPAIYPNLKARFRFELRPGRPRLPGLSGHGVDPAAARRAVCGPLPDAARIARRHVVFAGRLDGSLDRAQLCGAARRARACSASAHRCSIRRPRALHAWLRAAAMDLAQSLFQVGGNVGQALGPLAAALVVVRWGQSSLAFFALLALVSAAILWNVGVWYKHHGVARLIAPACAQAARRRCRPGQRAPWHRRAAWCWYSRSTCTSRV